MQDKGVAWPMVISLGPWATGFDGCIHSFLCVGGASFDEPGGAFPLVFAQRPCLAACPLWAVGAVRPSTLLPLRRRPSRVVSIEGWMRISSLFERRPSNFGVVSVAWLSSWPSM